MKIFISAFYLFIGLQAFAQDAIASKDGFWTFEKITAYDMSSDNTNDLIPSEGDYYYPTEDSFVEFNNGNVYIDYLYLDSPYSIEEIEFEDFFRNKLNLTETNATIKNYFKKKFDVEVGDTLLLCQPEGVLVFSNKLISMRVGEFFVSFVKSDTFLRLPAETDSFGGICIRKPIVMGYGMECTYAGKNMAECYSIMMEKFPYQAMFLQKTLPKTNIEYESNVEKGVYVDYDYRTPKHLRIYIGFYAPCMLEIIIEDKEALLRFTQYYP